MAVNRKICMIIVNFREVAVRKYHGKDFRRLNHDEIMAFGDIVLNNKHECILTINQDSFYLGCRASIIYNVGSYDILREILSDGNI